MEAVFALLANLKGNPLVTKGIVMGNIDISLLPVWTICLSSQITSDL